MNKNNNSEWIVNGQPGNYPDPNDGWTNTNEEWIDNGHPDNFPNVNDGWL